jgi:hypothetical protein
MMESGARWKVMFGTGGNRFENSIERSIILLRARGEIQTHQPRLCIMETIIGLTRRRQQQQQRKREEKKYAVSGNKSQQSGGAESDKWNKSYQKLPFYRISPEQRETVESGEEAKEHFPLYLDI